MSTGGFSIANSTYTSSPGGKFASYAHNMEMPIIEKDTGSDIEAADLLENESLGRPLVFMSAIFVGLAVALIFILLLGFGVSQVCHPPTLLSINANGYS